MKFAAAGILLPLLIAAVTSADYQEKFELSSSRQKLLLFRLKLTGALVGYNIFAPMLVALSLGVYYLSRAALPDLAWVFLLLVPLIFSYIGARRIPADRYVMFQNTLRAHDADTPFLIFFFLFSSFLALFFYSFYWFLSNALAGITTLLLLLGISIWQHHHRSQSQSNLRTIALVGFVIPLLIFLLQIFFNPLLFGGNLSLILEQFSALLLVGAYVLSLTTMWVTMWLRHPPQINRIRLLQIIASIGLLYFLLTLARWGGLAIYVALTSAWIVWRWRFSPHQPTFHPAAIILYLATLISMLLVLDSALSIWLNAAAYVLIATFCLWWVYQPRAAAKLD